MQSNAHRPLDSKGLSQIRHADKTRSVGELSQASNGHEYPGTTTRKSLEYISQSFSSHRDGLGVSSTSRNAH